MKYEVVEGMLTPEQIVFREILDISRIASMIFMDTTTEWQVNARNYEASIMNLESTVEPFLDSQFFSERDVLLRKARAKLSDHRKENPKLSLTRQGKDFEVMLSFVVAKKRLGLIMLSLQRTNFLQKSMVQAIEGGEGLE